MHVNNGKLKLHLWLSMLREQILSLVVMSALITHKSEKAKNEKESK